MARQTAQQRKIAEILARLEPSVARAFDEAIQSARRRVDMAALVDALDRGDLGAAIRLLDTPQGVLFTLENAIRQAYVEGGQMVAVAAPSALAGFNGSTPEALQWLRELSSVRIQGIQEETLEAVRNVLVAGRDAGRGSRAIARDIVGQRVGNRREGGILGLAAQQADSIIAARAKLGSGDPELMAEYFGLKLRDRRYDAEIKRAIAAGKPITAARLDHILEAHKSKALAYRGKLISKNETFQALEAGRYEAMEQALQNPDVDRIEKRWQHNLSAEPRLDHIQMNGTTVDFRSPFILPDGAVMQHAHDPDGGAKHNLGCRCITVYRLRFKE